MCACMYLRVFWFVYLHFYLLNSSQNVFELPFGWNINNHICVPLIIALDEKHNWENRIKTVGVTVLPCSHANMAAVTSSILLISQKRNAHHKTYGEPFDES